MAGFECEFVEKPPKAVQFECPICLLVLREPYQATCCGKSFCKECIHLIEAANQVCPTCNDKDFALFPNKGLWQSLYNFRVYCTHKSKGCEWTGELRELDNHLNSDLPADKSLQGCPYALIKCPLGCAGCVEGLLRKNYKSHVSDNIDKLLSLVVGQTALIKSIEQRNTQLEARLANIEEDKQHLEQHVSELEAKIGEHNETNGRLELKHEELEKDVKEMKGQLSSSEGDQQYFKQQIAELMTKVTSLDEKCRELEVKNRGSENEVKLKPLVAVSSPQIGLPSSKQQAITHIPGTYKPSGADFTMTDFDEYRRDNDMWHSPPFYTHPNGYKMCLRVVPNGIGRGKGTHLPAYVYLMKGEFDDQLEWPFKGDITIKLMNQEEDKDHIVATVNFNGNTPKECCQRVITEERSDDGWGISRFLPNADLHPKYLKNDCIKLCVKKVELF